MPCVYSSNVGRLKSKMFFDNQYRLRRIMEDIHGYSNGITPKKKGHLRGAVLKTVSGQTGIMEWREPYAQYQERGSRKDGTRQVRHYTTPGTGKQYAERAVDRGVKESYKYFGDWL